MIRSGNIDIADIVFLKFIKFSMKNVDCSKYFSISLLINVRITMIFFFDILLCLAITANLKTITSLIGIPFAANGAKLLVELGWNAWDYECDLNEELFYERVICKPFSKYTSGEWTSFYNSYIQNYLMFKLDIMPNQS